MLALYIYDIVNEIKLNQVLIEREMCFNSAGNVRGNRARIGDKNYMLIFLNITGLDINDCDSEVEVLIRNQIGDEILQFAYKQTIPMT